MATSLSIFHKGLILILSPILLEAGIVVALNDVIAKVEKQQVIESRYRESTQSVNRLGTLSFEACMMLFAMGMPGNDVTRDVFEAKIAQIDEQTHKVDKLMSQDPVLRPIFDDVVKANYKITHLIESLADTVSGGSQTELMVELDQTITKISALLEDTNSNVHRFVEQTDIRINESRQKISALRSQHSAILLFALISNLALAISLMTYFSKSIIKRLAQIRKNTELLRKGESLSPALDGSDEIAVLDQSFHAMQSALNNARRKEELFFENAADVIFVLNSENEFVKVNPAAQVNWGILSNFLIGQNIDTVLCLEDKALALENFSLSRKTGKSVAFESRVRKPDGSLVESQWSAFYEPFQKLLYCVVHDVSQQKELERSRQRYISIVGRDLKKPITSIAESFQAVQNVEGLTPKAASKAAVMNSNLQRLLALVNELSERKSFDLSTDVLNITEIDLPVLVDKAVIDVDGIARGKQIKVLAQVSKLEIQGDADRLMQVLVNLLSNAIKFSPEGADVLVSALDKGEFVELEVLDAGRGVPDDKREAIFEKFKQVEDSDAKRNVGTGLGLPICKQIVEQHLGAIGVRSRTPQGSIFWIRLAKKLSSQNLVYSKTNASDLSLSAIPTAPTTVPSATPAPKISRMRNLSLFQKGLILVGIPLVFELVFVGILTNLFVQSEALAVTDLRERRIANAANDLTFCYRDIANSLLLPAKPGGDQSFDENIKKTNVVADRLRKLLKGDKKRLEQLQSIVIHIHSCNDILIRSHKNKRRYDMGLPGPNQFLKVGLTLRFMMPLGQLEKQLQNLVSDSSKRQSLNPSKQKNLRTLQSNMLVLGMLLNIVIGLGLARLFSNDIRKRLEFVAANTRLLANEEELPPPLGGKDEIAVLDSSFHSAAEELAAARKRERTLFDNSNDVICSFDENAKLTTVNPAASKLWGYTKDELLSSNFFDYVPVEDRESTKKRLLNESSSVLPLSFEATIVKKNGDLSYVQWSAKRAAGSKEIFCMAHDISKRKEADRLRNEFLSMVSHDLRTPLSAILVTSTMLCEGAYGETPPAAAQKLSSVISDVNRLLELIGDLLDIEKMEAGMMALTIERVELRGVLEDAAKNCSTMLDAKNISLEIDVDEGLLEVDRDRFVQALSNLLSNSIDRSSSGKQIEVLAKKTADSYQIVIRDESFILDVETRENVFDRFSIGSESRSSAMSSLAVPLSKSIISAHGGTVRLNADESQGNEFVIQLPLLQSALISAV